MKQVWVNAATCSRTASTTCGAAFPTLTTAIPEPRSISELPPTPPTPPPPARSTNSGTVPPTAEETAAVRRAISSRERGPGRSVSSRRSCGRVWSSTPVITASWSSGWSARHCSRVTQPAGRSGRPRARAGAHLVRPPRADPGRRSDHAVEPPHDAGRPEDRPGVGRGQHRRPRALGDHPAHHAETALERLRWHAGAGAPAPGLPRRRRRARHLPVPRLRRSQRRAGLGPRHRLGRRGPRLVRARRRGLAGARRPVHAGRRRDGAAGPGGAPARAGRRAAALRLPRGPVAAAGRDRPLAGGEHLRLGGAGRPGGRPGAGDAPAGPRDRPPPAALLPPRPRAAAPGGPWPP